MKTKKITLVLAALLILGGAFISSSCTKDGSEIIIGNWKVVGLQSSLRDYSYVPAEDLIPILDMQFIFNQDNTGMMINNWWTIDGHGIDTTTFTYTVDDNKGVITTPKDNPQYTILSITDNKIVIGEKITMIGHDQDPPYFFTYELLFHCEKNHL